MSPELKVYTVCTLFLLYPIILSIIGRKNKWSMRKEVNYQLPWIMLTPITLIMIFAGGLKTPPLLIWISLGAMPIQFLAWLMVRKRFTKLDEERKGFYCSR